MNLIVYETITEVTKAIPSNLSNSLKQFGADFKTYKSVWSSFKAVPTVHSSLKMSKNRVNQS